MTNEPKIGDAVRTKLGLGFYRTTIQKIWVNELGTTLYYLESGQLLGRSEFDLL